jgi:hypothetical protein
LNNESLVKKEEVKPTSWSDWVKALLVFGIKRHRFNQSARAGPGRRDSFAAG